ncbi:hypothetical protein HDU96_002941 [Phlyctochytrium bullatum]|nr:hypothetical protein HDU96_002941 [Phlyctochytrium bullatum]
MTRISCTWCGRTAWGDRFGAPYLEAVGGDVVCADCRATRAAAASLPFDGAEEREVLPSVVYQDFVASPPLDVEMQDTEEEDCYEEGNIMSLMSQAQSRSIRPASESTSEAPPSYLSLPSIRRYVPVAIPTIGTVLRGSGEPDDIAAAAEAEFLQNDMFRVVWSNPTPFESDSRTNSQRPLGDSSPIYDYMQGDALGVNFTEPLHSELDFAAPAMADSREDYGCQHLCCSCCLHLNGPDASSPADLCSFELSSCLCVDADSRGCHAITPLHANGSLMFAPNADGSCAIENDILSTSGLMLFGCPKCTPEDYGESLSCISCGKTDQDVSFQMVGLDALGRCAILCLDCFGPRPMAVGR